MKEVKKLLVMQVANHVHGGWIQSSRQTTSKFPDSAKALSDAIEAAGPTLGPILLSMTEYMMFSFNEFSQSRLKSNFTVSELGMEVDRGESYPILHVADPM